MHKGSGIADRIGLQEADNLLRAVNYPRLYTSPDPMRLANPFAPVGSRFADRVTDDDSCNSNAVASQPIIEVKRGNEPLKSRSIIQTDV